VSRLSIRIHDDCTFVSVYRFHDLSQVSLDSIVKCLLLAFDGYFVKMPEDPEYWRRRFVRSRVNWALSVGCSVQEDLVGFIIHGVDREGPDYLAFNTGTGVIPAHRGQNLVDQMYEFISPAMQESDVNFLRLEVITANHRAISVYRRLGFNIHRTLYFYKLSQLMKSPSPSSSMDIMKKEDYICLDMRSPIDYAWDQTDHAIQLAEIYKYYGVRTKESLIGAAAIQASDNRIIQLRLTSVDALESVLSVLLRELGSLKFVNVPESATQLIKILDLHAKKEDVQQYEMQRPL